MREVSIIGVGIHPWGKFSEKTFVDLGTIAIANAMLDADIDWQKIETICSGIYIWGGNAGHLSGQYLASVFGETGIPIVNVYNACATGSSALRVAYLSIASGQYDTALAVGVDLYTSKVFFRGSVVVHPLPAFKSPISWIGHTYHSPAQHIPILAWIVRLGTEKTFW